MRIQTFLVAFPIELEASEVGAFSGAVEAVCDSIKYLGGWFHAWNLRWYLKVVHTPFLPVDLPSVLPLKRPYSSNG